MKLAGDIRAAFRIGLASARANLVPMVVLWMMALVLAVAYYRVPGAAKMLCPVRDLMAQYGWGAAFLSMVFYCGALPGLFFLFVRGIRPPRPWMTCALQGFWGGVMGSICNAFFAMQDVLFGAGADVQTLFTKMAVDQFVWTVLFVSPATAAYFFWVGRDCSWRRTRHEWPRRFYRQLVLPNLLPNWCVAIPVNLVIYAFPLSLRIHILGLTSAFWMLMCLQIGTRTGVSGSFSTPASSSRSSS